MIQGKYVILDIANKDFMKNEGGIINTYDTEDDAARVCGIYEFENVWVCKLVYNHVEPREQVLNQCKKCKFKDTCPHKDLNENDSCSYFIHEAYGRR